MSSAIALIPARANSKRFPRKNLAMLGDKPLLAWTIEAALESGVFDEVVLSSDSDEILQTVSGYQDAGLTYELRSPHLATDDATAVQVLSDVIARRAADGKNYQACSLLLPTCPFRDAQDIQGAFALLTDEVKSVVSMKQTAQLPQFMFRQSEDGLAKVPEQFCSTDFAATRLQANPEYFYPNGAIYFAHTDAFLSEQRFYTDNMKIYSMPEARSIDIDNQVDLVFAQAVLENNIHQEDFA